VRALWQLFINKPVPMGMTMKGTCHVCWQRRQDLFIHSEGVRTKITVTIKQSQ